MVRATKRKAWVSQLKRHLEKYGADGASWYVNWIDPSGRQRMKSCGAGESGKIAAESFADEMDRALRGILNSFILREMQKESARVFKKESPERDVNSEQIAQDKVGKKFSKFYYKQVGTRYGLTQSQVIELFDQAGHRCSICGLGIEATKLCVDHCHETNVIRGILCGRCNSGIGLLKDDAKLVENALKYLRNPPVQVFMFTAKNKRRGKYARGI